MFFIVLVVISIFKIFCDLVALVSCFLDYAFEFHIFLKHHLQMKSLFFIFLASFLSLSLIP